jgi:hypothetical protein
VAQAKHKHSAFSTLDVRKNVCYRSVKPSYKKKITCEGEYIIPSIMDIEVVGYLPLVRETLFMFSRKPAKNMEKIDKTSTENSLR